MERDSVVRVPETDAQGIFLVRGVEEADAEGRLLSAAERQRATREALQGEALPLDDAGSRRVVLRRAALLYERLNERLPMLAALLRATRLGAGLGWAVVLVAGLLGVAAEALGAGRHINLLSVPLFATLAWNLLVYLIFALTWLLRGSRRGPPADGLARLAAPLVTFASLRRTLAKLAGANLGESGGAAVAARGLSGYLTTWRTASAELVRARGRRLLHLGALALAAGLIFGMYLRGVAFEYRVTWESTFLDAPRARALLDGLLGPAATLLGTEVPDATPLEAPADGDAAPWIHLFAVTAGLAVVLPRGALALIETIRVGRLRRRVPVDLAGVYFRRALADGRGDRYRVTVTPYSFTPPPRALDALKTALLDLFGSRTRVVLGEPVAYGDEPAFEAAGAAEEPVRVLLFNLAQTPEQEVHGELVEAAREAAAGAEGRLLVVVDQGAYRDRLGAGEAAAERLAERRKAWDRVVRGGGGEAIHLDLEEHTSNELDARLALALAPPES